MDNFDDSLVIPVTYKGEELSFRAKVLMTSYTHKIQVEVAGQILMFEPDEERNYRVILDDNLPDKGPKLDVKLLQSIAEVLESVLK